VLARRLAGERVPASARKATRFRISDSDTASAHLPVHFPPSHPPFSEGVREKVGFQHRYKAKGKGAHY
jgi:hypothetical protein